MPARDKFTDEDIKKFVAEIEKEDQARAASIEAGKLAAREARRNKKLREIEESVRENFLYGDRKTAEQELAARLAEDKRAEAEQAKISVPNIHKHGMPSKIAGIDKSLLNSKYGYQLDFTKTAQGAYWKMTDARKREADNTWIPVSCTIMDMKTMPEKKRDNYKKQGFKIVRFLEQNHHPQIVRYFDQFLLDTEYYSFHEKLEYNLEGILSRGPAMNIIRAKKWGYDLIGAIHFLHSHGIAHRYISPKTIWLTKDFTVKLGNFGHSCIFWDHTRNQRLLVDAAKSSDPFQPKEDSSDGLIDPVKEDIYCWASTIAYLLTKETAPHSSIGKFIDEKLEALNVDGRGLFAACLDADPTIRPYASAVRNHVWFRNFSIVKVVEPMPAVPEVQQETVAEQAAPTEPEPPQQQ